jgi:hypothetical protein
MTTTTLESLIERNAATGESTTFRTTGRVFRIEVRPSGELALYWLHNGHDATFFGRYADADAVLFACENHPRLITTKV